MSALFPTGPERLVRDIETHRIEATPHLFRELEEQEPAAFAEMLKSSRIMRRWNSLFKQTSASSKIIHKIKTDQQNLLDGVDESTEAKLSAQEAAEIQNAAFKAVKPYEDPRLKPYNLSVLPEENVAPINWIVEDFLPEGLCMLAAPPKSGKSWLALDLANCVGNGTPFLDMPTVKSRVMYFALEDSKRRVQDRMRTMYPNGKDWSQNVEMHHDAMKEFLLYLELAMRFEAGKPDNTRLFIVDVFQKVRCENGRSASMYEKEYGELKPYKDLADKFHVCVLLIHHTRKMADADDMNMILGSNGIAGTLDAAYIIKKKRLDGKAKLVVIGRDIRDDELTLKFDEQTCRWFIDDEVCKNMRVFTDDPIYKAIAALLSDTNGNIKAKPTELANALILGDSALECENFTQKLGRWLQTCEQQLLKNGISISRSKSNGERYINIKRGSSAGRVDIAENT
jgi:hypothetical protein